LNGEQQFYRVRR